MKRTERKTCRLLHRAAAAVLLPALFGVVRAQPQAATPSVTENPAPAQAPNPSAAPPTHGVGFWDLPDRSLTIMLAAPPRSQEDRYARLRHYFSVFGCSGDHLSDVFLGKNSHHPTLLCTLPGTTASRIVITAALPRSDLFQGASDGWPDAVILPMLYHALKAQPRRAAFVFAELDGDPRDHVYEDFQKQLEGPGLAAPLALVSVGTLGFGSPAFANLRPSDLAASVRANAQALQDEAWRILHLQHYDTTQPSVSSPFSSGPTTEFPVTLVRDGPKDLPHILLYSNPVVLPGKVPTLTLAAFHLNLNFVALYLCDLDLKLTLPKP
jgi:hypothetical protein